MKGVTMFRTFLLAAAIVAALAAVPASGQWTTGGAGGPGAVPAFVLPDTVFAAVGRESNLWHEQLNLAPFPPSPFLYSFVCDEGAVGNRSFRWTPSAATVAPLAVTAYDYGLTPKQSGSTVLASVIKTAGTGSKNLLFIGDSIIDAAGDPIPAEVDSLFGLDSADGTLGGDTICIGTQSAGGTVYHEGHGGWTWERFLTNFTSAAPVDTNRFWDWNQTGSRLDFQNYVAGYTGGEAPDFVVINIGGNEANNAAAAGNALDTDAVVAQATAFLDTLFSADYGYPDCRVLINLPGTSSALLSAFGDDYGAGYDPVLYYKNKRALAAAYIAAFDGGAYSDRVDVCYAGLWADPLYGWPRADATDVSARQPAYDDPVGTNFVHPYVTANDQLADAIYSHLRQFHALAELEVACTNLLNDSYQWDSAAWSGNTGLIDVTGGQSDPWGGTTASLCVNETATAGAFEANSQNITMSYNYLLISVRVKNHNMGTSNSSQINIYDATTTVNRTVKLTWTATPSTSSAYAGMTHGAVDLGSDWWEFWAVLDLADRSIVGNDFNIRIIPNLDLVGVGNGVYMVGAQLEGYDTDPGGPCGEYVEKP